MREQTMINREIAETLTVAAECNMQPIEAVQMQLNAARWAVQNRYTFMQGVMYRARIVSTGNRRRLDPHTVTALKFQRRKLQEEQDWLRIQEATLQHFETQHRVARLSSLYSVQSPVMVVEG